MIATNKLRPEVLNIITRQVFSFLAVGGLQALGKVFPVAEHGGVYVRREFEIFWGIRSPAARTGSSCGASKMKGSP
jgi:hypothetical protein